MTNRPMHEVLHRRSPVTLRPEATVQEACIAMRNRHIGAVLVTDPAGCSASSPGGTRWHACWPKPAPPRRPCCAT